SLFSFTHPPSPATSTLSLHDALPICQDASPLRRMPGVRVFRPEPHAAGVDERHKSETDGKHRCEHRRAEIRSQLRVAVKRRVARSEEHTSELQSRSDLVCRLLLEKKK